MGLSDSGLSSQDRPQGIPPGPSGSLKLMALPQHQSLDHLFALTQLRWKVRQERLKMVGRNNPGFLVYST